MKVTLVDCTGFSSPDSAAYAAAILIFTKSTRLQMSPGLLSEIQAWPEEAKLKELAYMANTIPSSWEFCDYTFMIEGVTRAFTHQLVRTRTASFAQQTMRVLNVEGWKYATGPTIAEQPHLKGQYDAAMEDVAAVYDDLIEEGAAIEDARGILPTNILTNIVMKLNMRNFVDLIRKRSSPRVQGEYRAVLSAMKREVMDIHPWTSLFMDRTFERAAKDLDAEIAAMVNREQAARMLKLVDQLRAQS